MTEVPTSHDNVLDKVCAEFAQNIDQTADPEWGMLAQHEVQIKDLEKNCQQFSLFVTSLLNSFDTQQKGEHYILNDLEGNPARVSLWDILQCDSIMQFKLVNYDNLLNGEPVIHSDRLQSHLQQIQYLSYDAAYEALIKIINMHRC